MTARDSRRGARARDARERDATAAPADPPGAPSPPPIAREPRALLRAAAVLLFAWALVFAPQLFAGRVFALGDARVYRPFPEFSRERWQERHVRTYWNPYVLCGVPASASLADMRPQYLPDAALDAAEALRPGRWIPLLAPLFALLLGMVATAAVAWLLWDLPAAALAWAGLAYGLSPLLLVPLAFGHDAFLAACGLLPVALLALLVLFGARRPLAVAGAALALTATLGVQALTGHPQVVAYTGVVLVIVAIERTARTRRFGALALAVTALAWGAAISCAVWLPAIRYGAFSNRTGGVGLAQVAGMSLGWHELAALAWPLAVGGGGDTYWGGLWNTDYPRFLGTAVIALAVIAVADRRRRRPRTGLLLALALGALALAMGPRLGPLYEVAFRSLPFFDYFRVTSMGLVVAALAVALLSASAWPAAAASPAPRGRLHLALLAIAALGALFGVALALGALDGPYAALAQALRPALGPEAARTAAHAAGLDLAWRAPLLAAALELARPRRRAPSALAATALLALLAIDLLAVSYPSLARGSAPPASLRHPVTPLLARLGARTPDARVLSLRTYLVSAWQVSSSPRSAEMRVNDWIRWRAHAYGGEHGTPPAHWGGLELLQSVDAWRAVGIVLVSNVPGAPVDTAMLVPVAADPEEVVYRLPDGLGRAYAVPRVTAFAHDSLAFARLVSPGFDPAREAVTTEPAAAGEYPGSAACRVRWRQDEPDSLAFDLDAPAPAFLVVADTQFPGWRATIDGREVPIHRVNHLVRGVAVPAGAHRLAMGYVPEGWRAGRLATRVGMAAWLAAALAWLAWAAAARARRGAPAPA